MRPAILTGIFAPRRRPFLVPAFLSLFLSGAFLLAPLASRAAEAPPAPVATTATPATTPASGKAEDQSPITDEAQRIFQAYGDAVYQVQTIDLASDKKSSIGSGFQFTRDGLIATNYHVVAEAVQRPSTNRLEYLQEKGGRGKLKVLIADVVHDLAILRMEKPGDTFVELGKSSLPKGAGLFSLGNPHDIGLSILPGTNNGRNDDSFVEKIHFSGALNPGMSGGPVLAHDGKVVGINVSTQGNQIGFLVPVEPLRDLLQEYLKQDSKFDFIAHADEILQKQLLAGQQKNVDRMLKAKWESVPFGPFMVPGRITEAFKCWGDSNRQEKNPYYIYRSTCFSQDRQFLDEDSGSGEAFYTGSYIYRYDSIVAKPQLNLARFYSFYEGQYGQPMQAESNAGESNVTNFDCNSRFVDLSGKRWKASFCVRRYKKYPELYDMHLYMALVGDGRQGMIVTQISEGVSKENAIKLASRFMDEIRPRPGAETAAAPLASKDDKAPADAAKTPAPGAPAHEAPKAGDVPAHESDGKPSAGNEKPAATGGAPQAAPQPEKQP